MNKRIVPMFKKNNPHGPRYYFAYGANLNQQGMASRCPTAEVVGPAILHNHRLCFRGVADVVPNRTEKVNGVLWIIQPEDEQSLDWFEGYPNLYRKRMVEIEMVDGGGQIRCMIYYMNNGRGEYQPGPGYFRGIAEGYESFGLPIDELIKAANKGPRR